MDEASIRTALETKGTIRDVPIISGTTSLSIEKRPKGWIIDGSNSYRSETGIGLFQPMSIRNHNAYPTSRYFPSQAAALTTAMEDLRCRTGNWCTLTK